ncbi:9748_t:CDS:2, partial [Diversispora eburnea]
GCERNFLTLKWMIGDYRTRLDVQKLEKVANDCSIGNIVNLNDLNEEESSNDFNNNNSELTDDKLVLEEIIDFSISIFDDENINFENNTNNINSANFDYNPEEL